MQLSDGVDTARDVIALGGGRQEGHCLRKRARAQTWRFALGQGPPNRSSIENLLASTGYSVEVVRWHLNVLNSKSASHERCH